MHQNIDSSEQEIDFKSLFIPLTTKKIAWFIFIIGFIVFGNALGNKFVWDEVVLFYGGDTYHSIANVGSIFLDHSMPYYRPVPFALLATFYGMFGDTVFWYHFFQISLHCIDTFLVYILFKKFIPKNIAFALSLLFLVHPIQVESVSYIASVLNPLLLFFCLSAMLLAQTNKIQGYLRYSSIAILLFLAFLTKELGFLFLLFIPLYMILTTQKKIKKAVWEKLALSFAAALVPFIYLKFFITNIVAVQNTYTPIPIMNASLSERLISLPKIIFYYIITLFYPKDLAISQQWLVKSINFQDFFLPLIIALCFFSLFVWGYFIVKNNREKRNAYLFFTFWFFLTWCIHWNILIPLDMTVADRWFYVPFVGLLGAIGIVLSTVHVQIKNAKQIGIAVIVTMLVLFSIRTMVRNTDWKDPLTLYLADEKISTASYDLETQLGEQLVNSGRYAEAKPHLDRAIQLAPQFWSNWTVLGLYYSKTNQVDKAIQAFSTSIKHNSGSNIAYIFLADTYFINKSSTQTKSYLESVLQRFPSESYFIYLHGIVEYRQGNKDIGKQEVLKAYALSRNEKYYSVYNLMEQGQKL